MSRLLRRTRNETIVASGGSWPGMAALGYDSSRILRCCMPMKSEERIRAMVGMVEVMIESEPVDRQDVKTLLAMYMMSSMAEVMCGGLELRGLCGLRDRSGGCSSSWKAFSTDLRKKKVVMRLNGEMILSWILRERFEEMRKDGVGVSSEELSGGRHLSETKRVYRAHLLSMEVISFKRASTCFMSTPSSSLDRFGAGELDRGVPP